MNQENKNNAPANHISDHLANERTFLAWLRTSIGIMAFGFVVVKFALFLKQIGIVLGRPLIAGGHGYSSFIGVALVGVGALTTVLAYFRYAHIRKQLQSDTFQSSSLLIVMITTLIVLISILLVAYLIKSI